MRKRTRGIPFDCRPIHAQDVVFEVLDGPDCFGDYTYFTYWPDDFLPPGGVRGQIIRGQLQPQIRHWEQKGRLVRFLDRRYHVSPLT